MYTHGFLESFELQVLHLFFTPRLILSILYRLCPANQC